MKINECPNCNSKRVAAETFYKICYVVCKDCKNSTKDCTNIQTAIVEWNKNIKT